MELNKRSLDQSDSAQFLQSREVKKTCPPSEGSNNALTKEERKKIKNQKWRLKKKAERAQKQGDRVQKQDSLAHHTNGISSISLSDSPTYKSGSGPRPSNTHGASVNASPLGVPPQKQGLQSAANKRNNLPNKPGAANSSSPKPVSNPPKVYPRSKPNSSPFPVSSALPNVVPASSTAIVDLKNNNINGDDLNSFETLAPLVTPKTMQSMRMLGFPSMREIQARTIPALLLGKNLRGTAATGSGKTLSFIIPAVDRLRKQGFTEAQGLGVLILSPTRELSMQIMTVLENYLTNTETLEQRMEYSRMLIMGGTNMNMEAKCLRRGVTIVVATPGRLMDHLINTGGFRFSDLSCLVVDEADMILSTGFEPQMRQILQILPKTRQSMLFSATRGGKVEALVTEALGSVYHEVDITVNKSQRLNTNVKQEYVVCPMFLRLMLLVKLLQENKDGKVMVFFSLCKTVKFFTAVLNALNIPASCIHGRMSQNKRSSTFREFQTTPSMLMLCTDVAARGWDIPQVDLIVQVDPPTDASEFVHRVGRAAREEGAVGRAVLFMLPDELGYVHHLQKEHRTTLHRLEVNLEDLPNLQHNVYMGVHNNAELLTMAKKCAIIFKKGYKQLKPAHFFVERTVPQMELDVAFGVLQELPPRVAMASLKRTEALIKDHMEGGTRLSVPAFGGMSGPLPMGGRPQRPPLGPGYQRPPSHKRFS